MILVLTNVGPWYLCTKHYPMCVANPQHTLRVERRGNATEQETGILTRYLRLLQHCINTSQMVDSEGTSYSISVDITDPVVRTCQTCSVRCLTLGVGIACSATVF